MSSWFERLEKMKMRDLLARIIESYKDELDNFGYYELIVEKLDGSIYDVLDIVRELDDPHLLFEITRAVKTIEITEHQVEIQSRPDVISEYVISNMKYFKAQGVFEELHSAVEVDDKEAIFAVLRKMKDDESSDGNFIAAFYDKSVEYTTWRLREELKTLILDYEDLLADNIKEKEEFLDHIANIADNPKSATSDQMDGRVRGNLRDVVALHRRIKEGDSYIYTGKEFKEHILNLMKENSESKEDLLQKWKVFVDEDNTIAIETYGETDFY